MGVGVGRGSVPVCHQEVWKNTILQQVIPKYTSPLTPAEVLLEYTDSWAPARGVGEEWSGTRVSELFLSSSGAFLGQVAGTIAEPP